jgi:adenylate kinase
MTASQPRYVILLGPPGAGKGTQADLLEEKLGLPHVASGDLFREHLKNNTELGRQARAYMERGDLVPDDVTIAMVLERLSRPDCRVGAVLDGFPRTVEQAEALDMALAADGKGVSEVIDLQVSEQVLMERLTGRWICRQCQANYHLVFNPPKTPGRCDVCEGELYQRTDDKPETVARRLQVYFEQTYPLVDYYRQRDLLLKVDGEGTVEEVHRRILGVLNVAAE